MYAQYKLPIGQQISDKHAVGAKVAGIATLFAAKESSQVMRKHDPL